MQLARFNPVGRLRRPAATPVYAGERDPRESPAVRALLDALTGGPAPPVAVTGARSWRALPALYRSNAMFVTASADQAASSRLRRARDRPHRRPGRSRTVAGASSSARPLAAAARPRP